MWELDYKESWTPKNWCFWIVVLEKTLESPLDCKEIQPVHSEGDQPWDFFGRTDVEYETTILWPPDMKSWLIWKDHDAGKDWGQEEKGMTGDEMVGWHHRLNGHGFGWTPGVGDGQGGLMCYSPWGCKELDTNEWLNWTESVLILISYHPNYCASVAHCLPQCLQHLVAVLSPQSYPTLRPHGLQHARLPCPSLSPRACSNSCPSSQWCHPTVSSSVVLLLLPSIFPSIRVFSSESVLHIRWPKYWSFSFSISPSNECSGLISFRIN